MPFSKGDRVEIAANKWSQHSHAIGDIGVVTAVTVDGAYKVDVRDRGLIKAFYVDERDLKAYGGEEQEESAE